MADEEIDTLIDELSEDDKERLQASLTGASLAEGKHSVHTFLHNVATAIDTTKLGNLDKEELGKVENSLRSYKFLALFADKVMKKPQLKEFFNIRGEIVTSTSLSWNALLVKLAVTQKRELANTTAQEKKQNSGWFKKKDAEPKAEAAQ